MAPVLGRMFNEPPTINRKAIMVMPPLKPLLMEVKKSGSLYNEIAHLKN